MARERSMTRFAGPVEERKERRPDAASGPGPRAHQHRHPGAEAPPQQHRIPGHRRDREQGGSTRGVGDRPADGAAGAPAGAARLGENLGTGPALTPRSPNDHHTDQPVETAENQPQDQRHDQDRAEDGQGQHRFDVQTPKCLLVSRPCNATIPRRRASMPPVGCSD